MTNVPTPKPSIMDITPYKGGLSKTKSNKPTIKLSSNETPLGPSPKAIEAFKANADRLYRYPGSYDLHEAIASVYNLDPTRIVCGAGSDELISLICLAYAGAGDDVLYSQYGFLMYPISSMAVGARPITAPEKDLRTDVDALLASVTLDTKIVFIANPNNPTGSYITRQEIITLREGLPDHILLVLDGAYTEYVGNDDYSDGIEFVDQHPNIVVTRTFSKIYGLANLRVGWCYCPEAIADILNRVRGPFNVCGAGIEAAKAAVLDTEFTAQAKAHNDTWLPWMSKQLTDLGIHVYPSVGNFILAQFDDATKVNEHLMNEGIIARPVANYGLPDCIRFTIGQEEENKAVIETLRGVV